MSLSSTVQAAQSLAASGTKSITIPVSATGGVAQSLTIGVSATYAAVSATASGIQAAFQISSDGSSFTNAAESNLVVAPAATVLGQGQQTIVLNGPQKKNITPVVAVKVNLTNLDGTNAANIAVLSESSDII